MTIEMIPLNKLRPSKENPRKSIDEAAIEGLAKSILADGLLQNLVVAKPAKGKRKYDIISGERRYRAFQKLAEQGHFPENVGLPCEIKEGLSAEQTLRIATVENVQRQDLSPLEEAEAIATLAGTGEAMTDIASKMGISESTIKRRIKLLDLAPRVKDALSAAQITVSQAEAMSVAAQQDQEDILDRVIDGWYSTPAEITDRLIGELPCVAMAIFDKKAYQGTFITDLLAEDETTYFEDSEQFYTLQKEAALARTAELDRNNDWAVFTEGRFSSLEYKKAGKGKASGVVVNLTPEGRVEVHEGLIKKNVDGSVSDALRSNPKASYTKNLCAYIAMQKSAAVQAELVNNPRKAKEIGVARMLYDGHSHGCLSYLADLEEDSPQLATINAEALALGKILGLSCDDCTFGTILDIAYSEAYAYELVQALSDKNLDRLFVFLSALTFGQARTDELDTREQSVFNLVACDLAVDMRQHWKPSAWFLSRRSMNQLQDILKQSGLNRLFGNGKGFKKAELVRMMESYFAKVVAFKKPKPDQKQAQDWLPEAMQFPAIDPDTVAEKQDSDTKAKDQAQQAEDLRKAA
jgi:ParB family chromosome partitioning protein